MLHSSSKVARLYFVIGVDLLLTHEDSKVNMCEQGDTTAQQSWDKEIRIQRGGKGPPLVTVPMALLSRPFPRYRTVTVPNCNRCPPFTLPLSLEGANGRLFDFMSGKWLNEIESSTPSGKHVTHVNVHACLHIPACA